MGPRRSPVVGVPGVVLVVVEGGVLRFVLPTPPLHSGRPPPPPPKGLDGPRRKSVPNCRFAANPISAKPTGAGGGGGLIRWELVVWAKKLRGPEAIGGGVGGCCQKSAGIAPPIRSAVLRWGEGEGGGWDPRVHDKKMARMVVFLWEFDCCPKELFVGPPKGRGGGGGCIQGASGRPVYAQPLSP